MQVTGTLIKKLELETGTSKAGKEWQKQSIVIDTGEEFNNIVCVSAFGDKVKDIERLDIDMTINVMCNVYSREYKGKYYHNIEGWKFAQGVKAEEMVTSDDLPF
jgi:hypothetical protein|tara:strand:+ start:1290 stop:1601 length:312 start_codon:yes stop_codon:yes gene_type:complete